MSFKEPEGAHEPVKVLDPEEEKFALRLARRTLEGFLSTGRMPTDEELGVPRAGPFREKGAAFVTLKRHGDLRGCIGHIVPVEPLWECLRENAVSAAVYDSRFPPVQEEELGELEIDISVLTPARRIAGPREFIVGHHGIILEQGGCRAVFLPQVAAEQCWDCATTLTALCRKACLPSNAWEDPRTKFYVFEAQVFKEER